MNRKKIGIFGGTFDPPHFGHLNLAIELKEKKGLDEVWFVPTFINPLKLKTPPTPLIHRLEMVQRAIESVPQMDIRVEEGDPTQPSYMIDSLRKLILCEKEVDPQFYLLLGADAFSRFMEWRSPEEIVKLAHLLIGTRLTAKEIPHFKEFPLSIQEVVKEGLVATRLLDISSTEIRKRLSHGLYCGHLLPASVLEYIQKNKLYA